MSGIFACCFRRKPVRKANVDEESRLIPDPPQASSSSPLPSTIPYGSGSGLDKDRLGGIVQAKQGKMVNVSAFVPFNLYSAASSSNSPARAGSTSVTRYAFPAPVTPLSPLEPTHSDVQAQSDSHSRSVSRNASNLEQHQPPPGWDPNARRSSLHLSESDTSLHHHNRGPGPALMRSSSFHHQPVLGVRLVSGGSTTGSVASRRGRSRVKGVGLGLAFHDVTSASASASEENVGGVEGTTNAYIRGPAPPPPAPTSSPTDTQPPHTPPKLVTTPPPFAIRDIGNITIGWDD
ncbi:hypothetical protein Moror_3508 [Moniliophthora roreri MCA 2997]|uniref:Uncharacterized protein n=2 Tax=Moniliophthora roreri TaxID=221103 RepID=V2W5J7_MONRO|nr:hypothetical protein Moror_3508 [Moniliophthora roreri MCA 2997]KAI3606036.1 hypothetical protein WG66_003988 [Moniliophthora roreri]